MRTRRKKKKGTTHILVYCSDGLYSCCLKRAHTDHNSTARVGYLFIYYIAYRICFRGRLIRSLIVSD